ncbi:hypothetical protein KL907_004581 [Ogataea polymorpha]|nr:hypothetical protein KL907_004581 [Ogataea polymorpha]
MPNSYFPGSPTLRTPGSPTIQTRQSSIVEMLSSPPPIEHLELSSVDNSLPSPGSPGSQSITLGQQLHHHSGSHSSLSRNPSMSSSNFTPLGGTAVEWQHIQLCELVEQNKLITINSKISVEKAFETLVKNNLTSVPVEEYEHDPNCLTFDYTDLNSYLLLVLNKLKPESLLQINYEPKEEIPELVKRAQRGDQVPVSFVIRLTNKNPFIKLHEQDTLSTVVEILGTGVHRIAITRDGQLTGILSQRRLVKFLWENARRFPSMEPLLNSSIQALNIGSSNVISIYGDQLLIEALVKMHDLMISSLAVVDRNNQLLGNISVTDVKLVSKSSKSDLLYKSCLHFISVILNSRGLENGKDSFPIFHVTTSSSLARTMAKLVATQSHRLWIVKPDTQSSISSASSGQAPPLESKSVSPSPSSISIHQQPSPVSELGESRSMGRLVGVLSLTDILSLLAKTLGKEHVQPSIARKQRRRSSSSASSNASSRTTSSLEMFRKSVSDPADR